MNKSKGQDTALSPEDGTAISYSADYSRNLFNSYYCFINLLVNDLEIARLFGESLPLGSQDLFSSIICDVFCEVHVIEDYIELLLKQEFTNNVLI